MLYPRALAILEDLRRLEDDLSAVGQSVSGEIILAASTIPSAYILPKKAAEFKKRYPEVSFEVRTYDSAQVIRLVENNEVLIGVSGAQHTSEKLIFTTFMEDELVLAASAEAKINQRITTKTLLELPFILREEGSGTRKSVEDYLADKDIHINQLNVCAKLGSSTAVSEAIKSNLGVSILSRHAIADAVKSEKAQVIDILNFTMRRNFYIITATKRSLPYHYQVFMNFLKAGNNNQSSPSDS